MGDLITVILASGMIVVLIMATIISFELLGLFSIPIVIYTVSAIVGYLMIILGVLGVI